MPNILTSADAIPPVNAKVLGSNGWIKNVATVHESGFLLKRSTEQLNYADPAMTWGKTNCTATIDSSIKRFSNYTLRVDITDNSAVVFKSNRAIQADTTDLLLSLDVYIPFAVHDNDTFGINVSVSNGLTDLSTGAIVFGFGSSYLRQGWNSLRMWGGDTLTVDVNNTLAHGALKSVLTAGADLSLPIGYIGVQFQNMNGKSIYLDSIRKGAKVKPAVVIGFDSTGINVNDTVFPDVVAPWLSLNKIGAYHTVTYMYDLIFGADPRQIALRDTFGWDALGHTWNHGGSAPGATYTVTLNRASNVVTVTWGAAHSFTVGSILFAKLSGATPTDLNGVFEIKIVSTTTATYTAAGADGAATGTITLSTKLGDVTDAPGDTTKSILEREITDLTKVMRASGYYRGSNMFAWPNNSSGDYNTTLEVCTSAGVSLCRGIRGGTVKINEFGVDNTMHFGAIGMGSGASASTTEFVKNKILGAFGRGEHVWIYGHYVLDETATENIAHVDADLDYPPGSGGNPAPPTPDGWWYMGQIKKLYNETILPLVTAGNVYTPSPTEWAKSIGY